MLFAIGAVSGTVLSLEMGLLRPGLIGRGLLVFAALVPIQQDAPTLADGLEHQAAPLIVASALAGVATLALLWRRHFRIARLTALAAVATVISGWGVGQYPWLLVDQVRVNDAGGARSTLVGPARRRRLRRGRRASCAGGAAVVHAVRTPARGREPARPMR